MTENLSAPPTISLDQDIEELPVADVTDQLIEAEDDAKLRKLEREIKDTDFGQIDIEDFKDFNTSGEFVQDGTYQFIVESSKLSNASTIVDQLARVGAKGAESSLKFTLFNDRIKLSLSNKTAFCEILIKTTQPTNIDEGHEVAFIFDQQTLRRLSQTFRVDPTVNFLYTPATRNVEIKSGTTVLNLTALDPSNFADYHANLVEPVKIGQLNTHAIVDALQYQGNYSLRDDTQQALSIIQIMDSPKNPNHARVVAGNTGAIGVIESEQLYGTNLKIGYAARKPLEQLIGLMHPNNTFLFNSGNIKIIRDNNTFLGFTNSEFEFPPVQNILELKMSDEVIIPREELSTSLTRLNIVSNASDKPIKFELVGNGTSAAIKLEANDAAGKPSTDRIAVTRKVLEGGAGADIKLSLSLGSLMKTIDHFKTTNVVIRVSPKMIQVIDLDDESKTVYKSLLTAALIKSSEEAKAEEAAKPKVEAAPPPAPEVTLATHQANSTAGDDLVEEIDMSIDEFPEEVEEVELDEAS